MPMTLTVSITDIYHKNIPFYKNMPTIKLSKLNYKTIKD